MKRHLISAMAALCILGAADAAAQGPRHHHHLGRYGESGVELSIGYLHSGYKHKEWVSEEVERDKGLNGLYVGVTKDFTIVRRTLYFQTGATYEFQNASNRFSEAGINLVSDRSEHYIDIPVRLKFAMDVLPDLRAFVYAGPTFDFGLSSSLTYRAKVGDHVEKFTYNYYNGKIKSNTITGYTPTLPAGAYRAFDVMMGGAVGVELYDIAIVKLGFDWGLINKNKKKEIADYLTTHRNLFHLGIGVKF